MKLLVVVLVLVVGASARSSVPGLQDRNKPQSTKPSCPQAEAIKPCVCTVFSDRYLDMDCSRVVSEDQLMSVFQAKFPSTAFRRFTMYQNKNITKIRKNTFHMVSFEEIWMTDGVLEKIEAEALNGSSSTAQRLIFNMNSITDFPFSDLSRLTKLLSLDLRTNNLQGFPRINSSSLEVLYLSHNPLNHLPEDAFAGTKSIVDIHLTNTGIKKILPGTFRALFSLRTLDLSNNQIRKLQNYAIECSSNTALVDLGYNQIETVREAAFVGCTGGKLYFQHNYITTFEEINWYTAVSDGGYIDLNGNPLVCGCDIAWLVYDSTLQHGVDQYTRCTNGKWLWEVDHRDYTQCQH